MEEDQHLKVSINNKNMLSSQGTFVLYTKRMDQSSIKQ